MGHIKISESTRGWSRQGTESPVRYTGRIERFLAVAKSSGAEAVLVLNKADLCPDPAAYLEELGGIMRGVPAHVLSTTTGEGKLYDEVSRLEARKKQREIMLARVRKGSL